jgi:hypothetical protein
MLCHMALIRTDVSKEGSVRWLLITVTANPDDGSVKFFRNVGSYKSHMA